MMKKNPIISMCLSMAMASSLIFSAQAADCEIISYNEETGVTIYRDSAGGIVFSGLPTTSVASLEEQQKSLLAIGEYREPQNNNHTFTPLNICDIDAHISNINSIQSNITIQHGQAIATAQVSGQFHAEKCKIVMSLQMYTGTSWLTLNTWSIENNEYHAALTKSFMAESGKTYRTYAVVTVWIDDISESHVITTEGKTA